MTHINLIQDNKEKALNNLIKLSKFNSNSNKVGNKEIVRTSTKSTKRIKVNLAYNPIVKPTLLSKIRGLLRWI